MQILLKVSKTAAAYLKQYAVFIYFIASFLVFASLAKAAAVMRCKFVL